MPITDASDPTGAFNFGIDTLSDVERIEVIRGPMAALYGSGAIGGVINLISRRGTEPGIHWSGDLAGGYPALIRGSVTASGDRRAGGFRADRRSAVAARLRRHARSGRASTRGVPQGFRDRIADPEPRLHARWKAPGCRCSCAPQTAYFGFNTLGISNFRQLQLQRPHDVVAGPHRRHHPSVRRATGKRRFSSGSCRMTGDIRSRWRRPTRTRRHPIRGIIPTGPMCSGTTRCIWMI